MSNIVFKEDYNDRSFVVRGNTRLYKDQLRNLGGRWNPNLKGGCGWIFSKRQHEKKVDTWLKSLSETIAQASGHHLQVPKKVRVGRRIARDEILSGEKSQYSKMFFLVAFLIGCVLGIYVERTLINPKYPINAYLDSV